MLRYNPLQNQNAIQVYRQKTAYSVASAPKGSLGLVDALILENNLSGFVDDLTTKVSSKVKNTSRETVEVIRKEIYKALQKEIDDTRKKSTEFINQSIINNLPTLKKAIEEKGTSLSQEAILYIDNLAKTAVGLKPKEVLPEDEAAKAKGKSTPGSKAPSDKTKLEDDNFIVGLVPEKDIEVGGLKLLSTKQAAREIFTPQMIMSLESNVTKPLKDTVKDQLGKPLKKRAILGAGAIFGLGCVTGALSLGLYYWVTSPKKGKVK